MAAKAILSILSKFLPTAVFGWIKTIFDLVVFLVKNAVHISKFVESAKDMFLDAVDGASNAVDLVADKVSSVMVDALPVTFDGIARIFGLDSIPNAIENALKKLKDTLQQPLKRIVGFLAKPAKAALDRILGALGIKSAIVAGPVEVDHNGKKAKAWAEKPLLGAVQIMVASSPAHAVSPDCSDKAAAAGKTIKELIDNIKKAVEKKDTAAATKVKQQKPVSDDQLKAVAKEQADKGDCNSGLCVVKRTGMVRRSVKAGKRTVSIFGTGQDTGTPGHATVCENLATELAKSGKYEYITLDLAWRTATAKVIGSRERPDVIGVRCDGKVDAWEVQSKTDKPAELEDKIGAAVNTGGSIAGSTAVIRLPYPSNLL